VLARTDAPIGCGAARGPRGKQPAIVLRKNRTGLRQILAVLEKQYLCSARVTRRRVAQNGYRR
jgi:hypothetical protein